MFDMARHVRVKALLEEVEAVEGELTANELEMVRHLKEKYADPGHGDADDVIVLEVVLRNVGIRNGFDIDARSHTPRAVEAERRRR